MEVKQSSCNYEERSLLLRMAGQEARKSHQQLLNDFIPEFNFHEKIQLLLHKFTIAVICSMKENTILTDTSGAEWLRG